MGDYEDEQRRLQQLWESCMSDEESEFPDVYLSDEYKPSTSEETSSGEEIEVKRQKINRTAFNNPNEAGPSAIRSNNGGDQSGTVIIMYTIIVNVCTLFQPYIFF